MRFFAASHFNCGLTSRFELQTRISTAPHPASGVSPHHTIGKLMCRHTALLLLFVLSFSVVVRGQTITFGKTISKVGASTLNALDALKGYQVFARALGPNITVGGVNYQIKHVEYNDASDPELMDILYQRILEVDKADFIWSPFLVSGGTPFNYVEKFLAIPDVYSVPMMNTGIFEVFIFPSIARPWMNTYLPPLTGFFSACGDPLLERGANSTIVAIEASFARVQSLIKGGFTPLIPTVLIPPEDFDNADKLDALIRQWQKLDPDVLITTGDANQMLHLLDRIRQSKWVPRALHIVTGGGSEDFARQAGWKAANVIITSAFESRLNYSDPLYGSSLEYEAMLKEMFNTSSAISDAFYATAGTVMVEALKAAGTVNRAAVMKKLREFSGSTISGPISFEPDTGYINQTYFCVQFSPDGLSKHPVNPKSLPGYQPVLYPVTEQFYPPGYFPKNKKHLIKILVPSIVGGLVLLAIIAVVVVYILRSKYHLVFVPKAVGRTEEWT